MGILICVGEMDSLIILVGRRICCGSENETVRELVPTKIQRS